VPPPLTRVAQRYTTRTKRRTLGGTDLEVRERSLGANHVGTGVATGVAEEILDGYVALGGNRFA